MPTASWKEKGIVPDSDDEETSDSQSIGNIEERCNEGISHDERANAIHGLDSIIGSRGKDDRCVPGEHGSVQETNSAEDDSRAVRQLLGEFNTNPTNLSKSPVQNHIENHLLSPQRPFIVPQALLDLPLDYEHLEEGTREPVTSSRRIELPVEDEISKSYVRLSPAVSSPLSSPPDSPQSVRSFTYQNERRRSPNSSSGHLQQSSKTGEPTTRNASSVDYENLAHFNGRSLRQRTTIQLHPYIVEQEKYRRSLKARGLTPLRLAQAQDEGDRRRKHTDFQEQDSGELCTHGTDLGFENSSQSMDFDWGFVPSSPGRISPDYTAEGKPLDTDTIMEDDDEFPEIEQLLQSNRAAQIRMESRARVKTSVSKVKRPRLSRIQTQPTDSAIHNRKPYDVFDVPASPPTTSSPFPDTVATALRSSSLPPSSGEPALDVFSQDEPQFRPPPDLITPATSATKLLSDTPVLQSDSEAEDPFASELDDESPSSSGESIEIRQVSKRIRGVLPASHLRLDQQRKQVKVQYRTITDSHSISPLATLARRGVALPKASHSGQSPIGHGVLFISDDSDSDRGGVDHGSSSIRDRPGTRLESQSLESDVGFIIEDDTIDAMLPSRRRQGRQQAGQPRKKRRAVSNSMFGKGGAHAHQPKITDHLRKRRKVITSKTSNDRQPRHQNGGSVHTHTRNAHQQRKSAPPRLSILDVVDSVDHNSRALPQFLKIAVRTAKYRNGQGRQSPTRKFIRLDNREDTLVAQSVLREWREGTIRPKDLQSRPSRLNQGKKASISDIDVGHTTVLPSPMRKAGGSLKYGSSAAGRPRKLVVVKPRQTSMRAFVTANTETVRQPNKYSAPSGGSAIIRKRKEISRYGHLAARPAQLEYSEMDYNNQHPASAFRATKKALDAIYRKGRKNFSEEASVQLHRFLADNDADPPPVESGPPLKGHDAVSVASRERPGAVADKARPRKRLPQRLDASAAIYRQPSEPLVLEYLEPTQLQDPSDQGKLLGLGKFGTSYPLHFDIFPLQAGIFFHETTFIGSGRLSKIINGIGDENFKKARPYATFKLGDKYFQWGPWDENVSSEVGVCFDWAFEQLSIEFSSYSPGAIDVVGIVTSIVDYILNHLSFKTLQDRSDFVLRMSEILEEFSSRFKPVTGRIDPRHIQAKVKVLTRCMVVGMRVLQISRMGDENFSTTHLVENLLQKIGCLCVGNLLSVGLADTRKLYDDLQYLSVRERGIGNDWFHAEAWVIVIQILEAARIPRGSFWDVTTLHLLGAEVNSLNDARRMESMWYSMFSLLPLCEFDEFGIVVPGRRHKASFDNWILPQQLLKKVFSLYTSNSRQSPTFNDYCRALLSRCHHLMLEWGWWKCSGMIGTLFDFFASQKLAHLRNEEVYKSPRFLNELDKDPSLTIEPEDRSFHIFLKIIGLAITHLGEAEDKKSIRNLITRLLPNHDRQYPKEEAVHQRELASLRNHHDLLCTMFWAAPPDLRPSVVLIQNLVIANRSHKAACLINLRGWTMLSRFILTHTSISTLPGAYKPLLIWHYHVFEQLLAQYKQMEQEVREQAILLSQPIAVTEDAIQAIISDNERNTLASIGTSISAIIEALNVSDSLIQLTTAMNFDILSQLFAVKGNRLRPHDETLISVGIKLLGVYLEAIERIDRQYTTPTNSCDEPDSQDFGDIDIASFEFELKALQPLRDIVIGPLRDLVKDAFYTYPFVSQGFLKELTGAWASVASILIRKEVFRSTAFLVDGPNAVFNVQNEHQGLVNGSNLADRARVTTYWPLFLGDIVKKAPSVLSNHAFDIAMEWMLAISKPQEKLRYENVFTAALRGQEFFLLEDVGFATQEIETASETTAFHQHCIRLAIINMSNLLNDAKLRATICGGKSESEIKVQCSNILTQVMKSMKAYLIELGQSLSPSHKPYVHFVQNVIVQIRSYGSDIVPLPDFFVHSSASFWPNQGDPLYFLAGLRTYNLRLARGDPRVGPELYHYLYDSFKRDLVDKKLGWHTEMVGKISKNWDFFNFMLVWMIPAALQVAFGDQEESGWLLCEAWLPAVLKRIPQFIHSLTENYSHNTFQLLMIIFRHMMNGTRSIYRKNDEGIRGINPDHKGVISIVCRFGSACLPAIDDYLVDNPGIEIPRVVVDFKKFMFNSIDHFNTPGSISPYPNLQLFDIKVRADVSTYVGWINDDMSQKWGMHHAKPGVLIICGNNDRSAVREVLLDDTLESPKLLEVLEVACLGIYPRQGRVRRSELPLTRGIVF